MNVMVETLARPLGAAEELGPALILLGRGREGERMLPGWCDAYLAPEAGPDFFASRLWYEMVLAHALPAGTCPMVALSGPVLLPLLWEGARLRALVSPYSLEWRPLLRAGAAAAELREAGAALAPLLRGRPPTRLDAMDAAAPGFEALLEGLRAGGLRAARFRHFGNWRHPVRGGWEEYLATRPSALRSTIRRKLGRAAREAMFTRHDAPGPALEQAIAAYTAVRARSWKPREPFPHFDAALLRATAAAGLLRMGVLWRGEEPVAAQYWMLAGGRAFLLKLVHDEAARDLSPGTALTAMMIRRLIEEDGATELDLGRGDDPYKALWATERHQRMGVMLADPWHPAGLLELARHAAGRAKRRVRPAP